MMDSQDSLKFVDNVSTPINNNHFEFNAKGLVSTYDDKNSLDSLRYKCHYIAGIGTNEITCYFYDDEYTDFFKFLKEFNFTNLRITQFNSDSSVHRYLFYNIKSKASVSLLPLDWDDNTGHSTIKVIFKLK